LQAVAQERRHRYFEELAEQVQQRRFERCHHVNADALIEGLLAAPSGVALRKVSGYMTQHLPICANALAQDVRLGVFQRPTDELASRYFADSLPASIVSQNDDVAREVRSVCATEVQ
jgi:hypothetical protein